MLSLIGEYEIAIDNRGRMLLPASFRKQLGESDNTEFVINRGFESCLTLYPKATWTKLADKINTLNDFNPKVREFKRLFLNGANIIEVDTINRILIPKPLLEYAGIGKDLILTAQGDKAEIWDKETYYNYINGKVSSFSDLAMEVAGNDLFTQKNPFSNE